MGEGNKAISFVAGNKGVDLTGAGLLERFVNLRESLCDLCTA